MSERVVERPEIPLFDNKAFREAIINAILHNLWISGNEPFTFRENSIVVTIPLQRIKKVGDKVGNDTEISLFQYSS